jgi:NAD-dependent deacetylase
MPTRLRLDDTTWLLVLTGAGVSAESGVPTFRSSRDARSESGRHSQAGGSRPPTPGGGLWEEHPVEQVATPEGFAADPALVWRFYSARRRQASTCRPNPGHTALAALEERLGERLLLVTQNVDGLHRRAGSRRLIEIHGSLFETRCSGCERAPFVDEGLVDGPPLPECDLCAARGRRALLRPAVVWFGELLDPEHLRAIETFIARGRRQRLVFLAAGTSGAVYPAAGLVDSARAAGGETFLVNADPADNLRRFHHFVQGRSGELLPELFEFA